jgi:hypothetical protein
MAMFKRRYLMGVLALLSLATGSVVASAAETGSNAMPDGSIHAIAYPYHSHSPVHGYRGLHDYAGPPASYGNPWYDDQWDPNIPNIWSTGNGYY